METELRIDKRISFSEDLGHVEKRHLHIPDVRDDRITPKWTEDESMNLEWIV